MDLTIFELHLDDARFDAPLPGAGPDGDDERSEAAAAGSSAGGPSPIAVVAALIALFVLAFLARRLLAGDAEGAPADVLEG